MAQSWIIIPHHKLTYLARRHASAHRAAQRAAQLVHGHPHVELAVWRQ